MTFFVVSFVILFLYFLVCCFNYYILYPILSRIKFPSFTVEELFNFKRDCSCVKDKAIGDFNPKMCTWHSSSNFRFCMMFLWPLLILIDILSLFYFLISKILSKLTFLENLSKFQENLITGNKEIKMQELKEIDHAKCTYRHTELKSK